MQKLDEWIWMGLTERDETHIESAFALIQKSGKVVPEIKDIRSSLVCFYCFAFDHSFAIQDVLDVFGKGFAVIKTF